jgi:hypothetical protein
MLYFVKKINDPACRFRPEFQERILNGLKIGRHETGQAIVLEIQVQCRIAVPSEDIVKDEGLSAPSDPMHNHRFSGGDNLCCRSWDDPGNGLQDECPVRQDDFLNNILRYHFTPFLKGRLSICLSFCQG